MNDGVAARLAVIGNQSPPVARLASVGEVIEPRFVIGMVGAIGAVSVDLKARLVEERGRIALERVDGSGSNPFEER